MTSLSPQGGPHILALDIGGTKLAAGILSAQGELLDHLRVPTRLELGPRGVVDQLLELARDLLAGSVRPVALVGVGCGGPLDREAGVVQAPPNLPGWHDVPLSRWLQEALSLPVALDNDANAAALAEWRFGAGRGARQLVYLTVSTGIGGGVILDGRLYVGKSGNAAELGHIQIDYAGEPCHCGGRGCLEHYASGTSLARRASELARSHPESWLARQPQPLTARTVLQGLEMGDPLVQTLWDDTLDRLAAGVASMVHAFDPERVIIGGGLANFGEHLFGPLRERVAARTMPALWQGVQLLRAELADHVGLYGAAAVALEQLEVPAPLPPSFPPSPLQENPL